MPPKRLARRAGSAALSAVTSEKKFTSKWDLHMSSVLDGASMRPSGCSVPAFSTSPSMLPCVAWTSEIALANAGSSALREGTGR